MALLALLLRSWPLAIGGIVAVFGLSMLVRYVLLPRRLLGQFRSKPGPQRTITLDRSGLRHLILGTEQVFARSSLRKAVLTWEYLFLFFKPEGLLMLSLSWISPVASIEDVALLLARRDDEPAA